jgi:hypothetical protein
MFFLFLASMVVMTPQASPCPGPLGSSWLLLDLGPC